MISRNDPCWCGSNKKFKKCHYPNEGSAEGSSKKYLQSYGIIIKTIKQIEGIRNSCKLASKILDKLCKKAKKGVTTLELNDYAAKLHKKAGAIAAPLHYGSPPYPKSICTSLNEVICHGIPDNTKLKDSDILNIDVTCILDGYYGDTSRMFTIGEISPAKQQLLKVAKECLDLGIERVAPDRPIGQIGLVISLHAEKHGYSIVYQFCGHGVGIEFHEPPQVVHKALGHEGPVMKKGMIFTIEPMINEGKPEGIIDEADRWTVRSIDGKMSAQNEHTILVTDDGHEILTLE